jgi:hypothetical protein
MLRRLWWIWHRLQHRLGLEPCELLKVDHGCLTLRCTLCGEVMTLEAL